jgi:hypothetical protein
MKNFNDTTGNRIRDLSPCPLNRRLGWPQSWSGRNEEKDLLTLTELELRNVHPVACVNSVQKGWRKFRYQLNSH